MSFTSGQLFIGEPAVTDRTSLLWDGGQLSFSGTRGERGEASFELCLLPGETYEPQIGWPVWYYDPPIGQPGAECRFVGTIEDRDVGYVGDNGLRFWQISALSLEQQYDTQPCPEAEFPDGTSAGTIAAALFDSVAITTVPVTVGTIDPGVALDKRTYDPKTNVWSAIKQLAVDSNLIAYIDPRFQKFFFVASGSITSDFTLLSEDLLQNGSSPMVHFKQSRSDFRDRQITGANPNILPAINAQFVCDGSVADFTLPSLAQQVLGATLTTSTAGTATGTFTGVPSPGDTVTVGGIVYTWQSVLDNSVPNEVLIGASGTACAVNLVAAINAASGSLGTLFSFPTAINPFATALAPAAGVFTLRAVAMGSTSNSVALAESTANFAWSGAQISAGSNGLGIPLTVGVNGIGDFGLYYTPGSAVINLNSLPGSGQVLSVSYIGTGLVNVGNDAATTYGIGGQAVLSSPRNVSTQAGIAQQSAAVLAGFSVMPGQFSFQTYHRGIYPGDTLPVALTVPADLAARVNSSGPWLVQDVRGEWVEGWENLPDDSTIRHFRCTVQCINSVQFSSYQNTLQRLVDIGATGAGALAPPQEPLTGSQEAQLVAYQPPIQIADTTVGTDKGPHICVATPLYSLSPLNYKVGQLRNLQGVLRKTLTAALVIRINKVSFGSPSITQSWDFTFPSGWPVDDPIFLPIEGEVGNGDIFYPDIVSGPSPVLKDGNGVASVTVVWV